jgi:hypothetical protein
MASSFELATTGRAKCRGCGQPIGKGELRLGERLPNPFGDGEVTHWFHPLCAAYKRPEALLEGLAGNTPDIADRDALARIAQRGVAHPRLPRIDGAERSPTGQAKCRQCHEPIARGDWRFRLVFHQDGRFEPAGFVHLACRAAYFETAEVLEPALHFSLKLGDEDRAELRRNLQAP